MAFSKNKAGEFKYSIRGIDRVVEEKGNQFIRFAQIAWAGEDEDVLPEAIKYDIRKYTTDSAGNERMLKGVSFFSEEGPNQLANILVEEGFGNTRTILQNIRKRSDFADALKPQNESDSEDDGFDLRDIMGE